MTAKLPFRAFKWFAGGRYQVTCYVVEMLDHDLCLIKYHALPNVTRWRIGRFIYTEGIGGRQILDTNRIEMSFAFVFKPLKSEIADALEKEELEAFPFEMEEIEVIKYDY